MTRYTRTKGRGCDGKQAYPDKRAAEAGIASYVRKGTAAGAVEAYRCQCSAWHVGHRSPKERGHR